MKENMLSNCLMIKCEGQSIQEFDPQPAFNLWFNLKPHRRPGTGGSQQNKSGNNKRNALLIYLFTIFYLYAIVVCYVYVILFFGV